MPVTGNLVKALGPIVELKGVTNKIITSLTLRELVFLFKDKFSTRLNVRVTSLGTIVKTAEHLVPRGIVRSVIAVAKPMMQLVHEITELQPEKASQLNAVIPAVRCRPTYGVQHGVENHMNRMARDDEVNREIRVQEQVLDRMHGVSRPRARIDVLVMPGVEPAI